MKHMMFTRQDARPIETGDAGIVFTKNGDVYIFASGERSLDPADMTETQREQALMLDAFTTAMEIPGVLAMLVKMAHDPSVRRRVDLMREHSRATAN